MPKEVAGDAHGFVAVAGDDQVEAGQQFAGFGKRAIENTAVAITHAQGLRGIDRLQFLRGQQRAFGLQLVGVGEAVAHQRVEFFDGQGLQQGRLDVDQEQVLLHGAVLAGRGAHDGAGLRVGMLQRGRRAFGEGRRTAGPSVMGGLVAESWLPAGGPGGGIGGDAVNPSLEA